jgi:hypothetical protein
LANPSWKDAAPAVEALVMWIGGGCGQSVDEIDAEVARYHDQAAQLSGITPQNDNGNRS